VRIKNNRPEICPPGHRNFEVWIFG